MHQIHSHYVCVGVGMGVHELHSNYDKCFVLQAASLACLSYALYALTHAASAPRKFSMSD